jgi:phage tail-like protein
MVQTPSLAIQIASMHLSEAIESEALSVSFSRREETSNQDLWLYPGEPEQILVTVENTNHKNNNRNLQYSIEVSGDYPARWCNFNQQRLFEIAPNRKIDKAISFQVEADFFENQQALNQKTQLQINYQVQIQVFLETTNRRQLVEYQLFNLLIRPETSYLNFLPSIFGERDIARRFVSIFEQAFDPVVQTTDVLWAYFDPLTAPEAFLPFLAKWVGWEIDERWTIQQQRQLIRNAVTLYRWHGTKHGLRLYLHYYTGLPLDEDLPESQKHISIEENFNDGLILGEVNLDENPMLGGGKPYHFTVRLRTDASNRLDEELVQEIIERQKPAFSTYELLISTQ